MSPPPRSMLATMIHSKMRLDRVSAPSGRGSLIHSKGPVLWRRESRPAPSRGTDSPCDQDVHEPVSHQNNRAARFGVASEDRRGFRGTLAGGPEGLHARRPAAKPGRAREPSPQLRAKAQAGPKGGRQLGLSKARVDQRRRRWGEQPRRVPRPAQRTRDQAFRCPAESLELSTGTGGRVERCVRLPPQPLGERMSGDGCSKVPGRLAVAREDDLHHGVVIRLRRRILRPSHPISTAGRKTTKASWMSWPAKPLGSPRGVHGNRNSCTERGAKNSTPKEYRESASRQPWERSAKPRTRAIRDRCCRHGSLRKKTAVMTRAPISAKASECVMARCAKSEVLARCSGAQSTSMSGRAAQAAAATHTRGVGGACCVQAPIATPT